MWSCPKCGEELPDGIAACWVCGTDPEGAEDPNFAAEKMPEEHPPSEEAVTRRRWGLSPPVPGAERVLWIEVLVVLTIIIAPDLLWSIDVLSWGQPDRPVAFEMAYTTVRSLVVTTLVLYVIWRSDHEWAAFGIDRPRWLTDIAIAVVIVVPLYVLDIFGWAMVWSLLPDAVVESWSTEYFVFRNPATTADWLMFVTGHLANGFAEELSMRAYLFLRLRQLLGSSGRALLLSSLAFASYHLYQGPPGVIGAFVFGVLICVAFMMCRRLWPIALAHAFYNFILTFLTWG